MPHLLPTTRPGLASARVPALALTCLALAGTAASTPSSTDVARLVARPAYHLAPVLPAPPGAEDRQDPSASARHAARVEPVPDALRGLGTRALTLSALRTRLRAADAAAVEPAPASARTMSVPAPAPAGDLSMTVLYTPAQIRAAYGLPPLPATGAMLDDAARAAMGAGQTIYLVDAYHSPDVARELDAFSSAFGLPACAPATVPPDGPLPAGSVRDGCTLSVVATDAAGRVRAASPAVDDTWATEIAIDVQWAHATAPLARLVVIETPDAGIDRLLAGVRLAGRLGPGVVSMSFSAPEGAWTGRKDGAFAVPGLAFVAATGDDGPAVGWPAVSPRVLAVGGSSLDWQAGGTRHEAAWSLTGGGFSRWVATPPWQAAGVPVVGRLPRRGVADVAFNADPRTGQYLARAAGPGGDIAWLSAGGTSLATPQWAGLLAIADARRALGGQAPLASPAEALYTGLAGTPGGYAATFDDIVDGANGPCIACRARGGWDAVTGLGTPRAGALLDALAGQGAFGAPVVRNAVVSATAGRAFAFTMHAIAPRPVVWRLVSAPRGVALDDAGRLRWPQPRAGRWTITVQATDPATGLAATGTLVLAVEWAGARGAGRW